MQTLLLCHAFCLLLHPGEAINRWVVQDQKRSVEIYAEFDPGMPAMWQHISGIQQELAQLAGIQPTGDRVQIMLFSSHSRYVEYLLPQIGEAKYRRALFYMNGDVCQVYAWRSRSLMTDIRHELTHVFLHQNLQFLPLWIDEGFAEYLEEPAISRHRSTRSASIRWKARMGWTPSLKELEAIPSAAEMTEDQYQQSWAWIDFLLNESEESRACLNSYLQIIVRGEAPGPFSDHLATNLPDSKNRMNSYFRKFRNPLSSTKE